jgi:hypothetical protein
LDFQGSLKISEVVRRKSMFAVTHPELYFWKVYAWLCSSESHGHEFGIYASKRFLYLSHQFCRKVKEQELQMYVRRMSCDAGLPKADHDLLHFGSNGLEQIDWPDGGGCWLAIERSSVDEHGAKFSTHNCDTSTQQSFLMAVWMWWAALVEDELPR